MTWLYWLILFYILYAIVSSAIIVFRSKNKKLEIKRQVNTQLNFTAQLFPFHIIVVFILLIVGSELISKNSSDIFILNFISGFKVGIYILFLGIALIWLYDECRTWKKGKQSYFTKWIKFIDNNGVWRYTEEEKAIIKKEKEEFDTKLRKKYPKLMQWVDKYSKGKKDGTF